MCTVAEASLNRCGLVISVLEFPVVERWVSGLSGWRSEERRVGKECVP